MESAQVALQGIAPRTSPVETRSGKTVGCGVLSAGLSYGWIFSPLFSMSMNWEIFRARVSAFFTFWILNRTAYRFWLSRVAKNRLAFGLLSKASCKSSGTVDVLADEYAASQRPSCLARLISRSPAGRILPAAINASAFAWLIFDQMLLAVLG